MSKLGDTLASMGTSFATSFAGGLGSSLLGGLFGFGDDSPDQRELMQWQEQMLDKQLNFQSSEAEKNRLFQSKEAGVARDWNSIVSQMQRAQQAGVNPYALVSNGSYGSAAGAIAPSGSQAGGGSVPTPAPSTYGRKSQVYNAVASSLESITQGLSNVANAKKTGVDTEYVERSMNDLLAKLKSEATYQDLLNDFQRVTNNYSDKRQRAALDEIKAKIDNLNSLSDVNKKMLDKLEAEIFRDVQQGNFTYQQAEQIRQFLAGYFDKYWQSVVDKNKADARAADASAVNSIAQAGKASAETELVFSQKVMVDLTNDIKKATNPAEKESLVEQYIQRGVQAGIMTDLMKEQLEQAVRNNDWGTVEKILGSLNSLSETFKNVGVGLGAVGGSLSAPATTVIGFK